MKEIIAVVLIVLTAATSRAAAQCCGDCDGDGQTTVDEIVTAVTRALTGCQDDGVCQGVTDCGNGVLEGGEQCDFGTLNGVTCASLGFGGGTLQCGAHCIIDTSGCIPPTTNTPTPVPTSTPTATHLPLVDNGDGTITDPNTGLMWEKKSADGGIHDYTNNYSWSAAGSAADGTVYTAFLAALNTPPCFAGHCDWRLPRSGGYPPGSSGEPAELESIRLAEGCPSGGKCVLPIFDTGCVGFCSVTECSCTLAAFHWSSTSSSASHAWGVEFETGSLFEVPKTASVGYARAVRDAP
jgi:hypothetical protein